jgi:hypothetical protein
MEDERPEWSVLAVLDKRDARVRAARFSLSGAAPSFEGNDVLSGPRLP